MAIQVTDLVLRGNGFTATFDDGSTAECEYEFTPANFDVEGLSAEQEAALQLYMSTAMVYNDFDPRMDQGGSGGGGGGGAGANANVYNQVTLQSSAGNQVFNGPDGIIDALALAGFNDTIIVNGGNYNGDFTVPPNTRVLGQGGRSVVVTNTAGSITLNNNSTVSNIEVIGVAGVPTFIASVGAGQFAVLIQCTTRGAQSTAYLLNGNGALSLIDCTQTGTVSTAALEISSSGNMLIQNFIAGGDGLDVVSLTGLNSRLTGDGLVVQASIPYTRLLHIQSECFINLVNVVSNGRVDESVVLDAGADGANVTIQGGDLSATTTALFVDASLTGIGASGNSILSLINTIFRALNVRIFSPTWVQNTRFNITHFDPDENEDPKLALATELSVGKPLLGFESAFGEGDSTVRAMLVFQENAGVFTDVSADAASQSGSPFQAFQTVNAGQIMYVGNTERQFNGIKTTNLVPIALGGGSLIWEYWDGGTWVPFRVMCTQSDAPYAQLGTQVFSIVESQQIRFGDRPGWLPNIVNGVLANWIRCRVVSNIAAIPVFERFKLHTNRTEINADGFVEYFGSGQPIQNIPWHFNLRDDLAGASPGNGPLDFSPSINITPIDNRFQDNALDGVGGILKIPVGLDTSRSLVFEVYWVPRNSGSGDCELQLITSRVQLGDDLNGTLPEVLQTQVIGLSPPADSILRANRFEIDIEPLRDGEFVAFGLRRDARASNPIDTYTGNIDIVQILVEGTFWH